MIQGAAFCTKDEKAAGFITPGKWERKGERETAYFNVPG
jgi:hypothetical protein